MKQALILALFGVFAACGPLNEGRSGPEMFQQMRKELIGDKAPAAAPALPPEIANAAPGDVLVVTLRSRNAVAAMLRAGENGSRVTWISPGKVTMTFDAGILIATRGLGDDLMGADIPGLRRAIDAGSGTVMRQQSYLSSLDQIDTVDLTCTITSPGTEEVALLRGPQTLTRVDEACKGSRLIFDNIYWLNTAGEIVKSRQAIAGSQGYIDAEVL